MQQAQTARRALVALTACVAALAFSATARAAGPQQTEVAYAKVHRLCRRSSPHGARCMALELVAAAKGSRGARRYVRGAGASSKGPAGGLTPADLASAYGYRPSDGGTGQTVAVIDAYDDPYIESDLGEFDKYYGLPECTSANGCFEKVDENGSTTQLPEEEPEWAGEISLDVETVHSVCPNCKVLLVEANSEEMSDLAASVDEAVALGATEISNSYGIPESALGATEQAAYNHPGLVITASAGDSGFDDWGFYFESFEPEPPPAQPNAPASLPTVVAVGGTSLKLARDGARESETVWNDWKKYEWPVATGSGCSTIFAAPQWQQAAPGWAHADCEGKRLDNDVAAVADPYTGFDIYDSYEFGSRRAPHWLTIGGTSLSSPLIASLYALSGGSHGVEYPAQTLYEHLGQGSALYDISEGASGYCDGESLQACGEPKVNEEDGDMDCLGTTACNAAVGFDGPSGVGAPNGLSALDGPPSYVTATVVTKRASAVTASSATLNGTLNTNGASLSACTFEYGSTTSLGQSVPCSSLPGEGTTAVAVSAQATGLAQKTRYYFRISATTPGGTSSGVTKAFKTAR